MKHYNDIVRSLRTLVPTVLTIIICTKGPLVKGFQSNAGKLKYLMLKLSRHVTAFVRSFVSSLVRSFVRSFVRNTF